MWFCMCVCVCMCVRGRESEREREREWVCFQGDVFFTFVEGHFLILDVFDPNEKSFIGNSLISKKHHDFMKDFFRRVSKIKSMVGVLSSYFKFLILSFNLQPLMGVMKGLPAVK